MHFSTGAKEYNLYVILSLSKDQAITTLSYRINILNASLIIKKRGLRSLSLGRQDGFDICYVSLSVSKGETPTAILRVPQHDTYLSQFITHQQLTINNHSALITN